MSKENENNNSEHSADDIKMDQHSGHSELQNIIEAALFTAEQPIGVRKIQAMFDDQGRPEKEQVEEVIVNLQHKHAESGLELVRIGAGWRFQTSEKYAPWLRKLSADRAPRYSRAQLETMAIIAYQQPVTRGDIEETPGFIWYNA